MKRLALLFLLPFTSGALFAQVAYSITPSTLPAGTVGVSYPSQALTVSPLALGAWSISAGSLPPGLTLSPTSGTSMAASISGMPTVAGNYTFTVQANVGIGTPILVQRAYSVTIAVPSVPPITSSPAALPAGVVGTPYQQTLTASGGYGPGTYSFSVDQGTLPPGLALSPVGNINGTPTAANTYSFNVRVVSRSPDGVSTYVSQPYSITIGAPSLFIASGSLPDGAVGVAYYQNLTATGGYGAGTYTFTWTGGTLPQGLSLSANGAISGTPTATGLSSFTVRVTSQSGTYPLLTASGAFSINIPLPPLTITTSSLPAGTVGATYSQALNATGGTPPYTWQWTGGSLPGGLTMNSSGTISGTPTAVGSSTFQVTVSDSLQASASASFTIRIAAAALVITTTSLPGGNVGSSYSATLAATGGTPPYSWSVASKARPSKEGCN